MQPDLKNFIRNWQNRFYDNACHWNFAQRTVKFDSTQQKIQALEKIRRMDFVCVNSRDYLLNGEC